MSAPSLQEMVEEQYGPDAVIITYEDYLDEMSAIRCALADLIGAWQDWNQRGRPDSVHDWKAHEQSIIELATEFGLTDELPEELK